LGESASAAANSDSYSHLLERAVECIDKHGGTLDDARLVGHVFGVAGSEKLWAPLLHTILHSDPRVSRLPNGWWTTSPAVVDGAPPPEFVVVDVETTGLKARQHRIIEVALVRYSAHSDPFIWSSLVNPGRRIPDYIRKLTGIDDSMVLNAPEFRSLGPTVQEIIGDLPIVGHNVDFDISFLNAELARSGLPRLVNVALDTMPLADELIPGIRRLSLRDVARELGVTRTSEHRALADAEITLTIYHSLVKIAAERGIETLEQLLDITSRKRPRRTAGRPVGRGRSLLDTRHLETIPHAAGVYVMRDENDRVIYIGKAKDLRKRVGSYYSQPLGYTRKMDGLIESISAIETTVVGTELEALILESQLIRRYRPRFNTVQRNAEQYAYIRVDVGNRWPTVTMAKDRRDDGATYYGPFRSSRRAKDAVQLINGTLPLRTCKRSFKDGRSLGSPCIELSLNRCAGPCMGLADPEEYLGHVNLVREFLAGNEEALLPSLQQRLELAAAALDFEKAGRLRDDIAKVIRLVLDQARMSHAARHDHLVLVLPSAEDDSRQIWHIVRGRHWAQIDIPPGSDLSAIADRLERCRSRADTVIDRVILDHHSIDEAVLLSRWMNRSPDHPALIPWLDGLTAREIVDRAVEVDLTDEFGSEVESHTDGNGSVE
jgi:DNA polymerase III subunit epsilon